MSDRDTLYRDAARQLLDPDDIAVPENAEVSFVEGGIDAGAWVQIWVWVREDDIDLGDDE